MFNVITPLNRPENIPCLTDMLTETPADWYVITDLDSDKVFHFEGGDWIYHYLCPNTQTNQEFWVRCNYAMNWMLDKLKDLGELTSDNWFQFLNDDDALESQFHEKIVKVIEENPEAKVILTSMQRGHQIPKEIYHPARCHRTDTLVAAPSNVRVGRIGLEQILVRGDVLAEGWRFPLTQNGDGEFIVAVTKKHPPVYAPETYVWFNFFEPGRWNTG
jgi:hypothetical protein